MSWVGKTLDKMPKSLHRKLTARARQEGVSLNTPGEKGPDPFILRQRSERDSPSRSARRLAPP